MKDKKQEHRSSGTGRDKTEPTEEAKKVASETIEELNSRDISADSLLQLVERDTEELGAEFTQDRDRGILSPKDRDYLWGQIDYAYDQSEYKARERIRNRVQNALLDFTDLELQLEEDDCSRIFADLHYVHEHLVMVLAFLYGGIQCDVDKFEDIISEAIYFVESEQNRRTEQEEILSVDVAIDINRTPDPAEITKKLDEGEALTDREIGVLVRHGDLPTDQLAELAEQPNEVASERVLRHRFKRDTDSG